MILLRDHRWFLQLYLRPMSSFINPCICIQILLMHYFTIQFIYLSLLRLTGLYIGEVTSKRILCDIEPEEIVRVSNTNVLGSLLCCREAIHIMKQQPSSELPIYHIFNMGFSRWGAKFTRSAATHKMTKVALTQLSVSLNEELKNAGMR